MVVARGYGAWLMKFEGTHVPGTAIRVASVCSWLKAEHHQLFNVSRRLNRGNNRNKRIAQHRMSNSVQRRALAFDK